MKSWKASSIVLLVLVWSGAALAQDAVKVDPAHYKVVFENESVRVLKIGYAPGGKSTMHQHPDSIVVPLSASKVRFGLPDGKTQDSDLANEAPQDMPAGTHNPTNVGTGPVDALLIEFKTVRRQGRASYVLPRLGVESAGRRSARNRLSLDGDPDVRGTGWKQARVRSGGRRARPWRAIALDRRQARETSWARGDAQSSAAASRMRPRTPAGSRWT